MTRDPREYRGHAGAMEAPERETSMDRFLHYEVLEDGTLDAPCGCFAHDPGESMETTTEGHPFCDFPPAELLAAEERGELPNTGKEQSMETLEQFFEFETCPECGRDAEGHYLGADPLGLPHVYCLPPEYDVTFVRDECDPWLFSASMMELGSHAGAITWRNCMAEAEVREEELPIHPFQREALCEHFASFGAWDREEVEEWTDQELRALVIQDAAAIIRENENLPEEQRSGRVIYGDDGRLYYYVGD